MSWSAEQYTLQNNLHPTCQPPTRRKHWPLPYQTPGWSHHLCDHCQFYDLLNQLLVDLFDHLGDLLVNYPIHHHLKLDLFYLTGVKLRDSASSFHCLSSSIFTCLFVVTHSDISSHLDYMMFPSIQTIYFLWGYDPGNMLVPTYLLMLSWAQFAVV